MFYAELDPFKEFSQITDRHFYRPLPDNWLLVITDIENSTEAVRQGQYKDVNLIGAACITAVLNLADRHRIPYLFGGDGATLAIPPELSDAVDDALASVRQRARDYFTLTLRVGRVPISDIRQAGSDLRVAKFELTQGNYLAAFSGGGVELAEHWIKREHRWLLAPNHQVQEADLDGLSCRWQPLQARNGVILSMLAQATCAEEGEIYTGLIKQTSAIVAEDNQQGTPISQQNLVLRWPPTAVGSEIKATQGGHNRWWWALRTYGESLLQFVLDRFNIPLGNFKPAPYRQEMEQNSDYRRFDGTLRILFDCAPEQADLIEATLQDYHSRGQVAYGLHRTDRALMTCVVFDFSSSEHIHFLDGADGGFSMAAVQLKSMLRSAKEQQ
ncbi:MAG: DUF3095 domain-containing protein [Motiliproteus sp.]|nr:DUF3095 domain-containing protein [Motiliproteus sp.]MCW9051937.1 DUF3095 domain-containing protein [Motiliproteus sp.]